VLCDCYLYESLVCNFTVSISGKGNHLRDLVTNLGVVGHLVNRFDSTLPVSILREFSHVFSTLCQSDDDNGTPPPETAVKGMLPTLNILVDHSDYDVSCAVF